MKIFYKQWQIKSYPLGGYVIQKQMGKQWKEASYFRSLLNVKRFMLEQEIHHRSETIVFKPKNDSELVFVMDGLIHLTGRLFGEIEEVLHD